MWPDEKSSCARDTEKRPTLSAVEVVTWKRPTCMGCFGDGIFAGTWAGPTPSTMSKEPALSRGFTSVLSGLLKDMEEEEVDEDNATFRCAPFGSRTSSAATDT